ncbi:hypothetical protein N7527_006366 [Penicillium freii]|nr:hypothetical protein N7527_006366 [Penicillium freii]
MAASVTHSASGLLVKPLPYLDIPARRTVSHALHRIKLTANFLANFLAGSVHEEQIFGFCSDNELQECAQHVETMNRRGTSHAEQRA